MILLAAALAAEPVVEQAIKVEMDRALAGLRIEGRPSPYVLMYDLLDGQVTTTFAEFGAVLSQSDDRYRNLRVDVRVGDYTRDNSNFSSFGASGGVSARRLPAEENLVALRRETWLATDQAFKDAVEQYARKEAALRGNTTPRPPDFAPITPLDVPFDGSAAPVADGPGTRALAERLSAVLAEYPAIEVGQAIARDWQGWRLVLTSEGSRVWRPTGYTVVRVEGMVRLGDGGEMRDSRSWVVRRPADLPPEADLVEEIRAMAGWLTTMPAAPKEGDYLGPVLFEGPAATEVFAQLLPGEVLGTPSELEDGDDGSRFRPNNARLGRRLLPLGWEVRDDPLRAGALGAYPSDQEGVVPVAVELVKDGVLRDVLMSRVPSSDRSASTGHGRSLGNDRRAAMPAVVSVVPPRVVPMKRLRAQGLRLAAQTGRDYLLVIRRIEPPVLSGDLDIAFTGEGPLPGLTRPYEAFRLYRDGREEPVRSMQFSGVDRRVLKDIALAGPGEGLVDTLDGPPGPGRFQIGPTGGIPVSWEVPAILVTEVELTGSGSGEPRVLKIPAGSASGP